MTLLKVHTLIAIAAVVFSLNTNAESGVNELSPELRSLLSKEMLALQTGMQSIIPAYVAGDLDKVAHIAKRIKNSFILKQNITANQKKELGTKLPKSFLKIDQQFHKYAGMLEHVAEEKNTELVGFYFSKLSEVCVACHSEYATHKFPKFNIKSKNESHHH
jgi:hypothetical protein